MSSHGEDGNEKAFKRLAGMLRKIKNSEGVAHFLAEFFAVRVLLRSSEWHCYGRFKVNRLSFSGSIPPTFERKIRHYKQRFGKIAPTIVLDKDEYHQGCNDIGVVIAAK